MAAPQQTEIRRQSHEDKTSPGTFAPLFSSIKALVVFLLPRLSPPTPPFHPWPPGNSSLVVIAMLRGSPERTKAFHAHKFQQSLVDVSSSDIEARDIQEKDLETDHLEWLLGPDQNSPRSVGISPAYSQKGGLVA